MNRIAAYRAAEKHMITQVNIIIKPKNQQTMLSYKG